MISTAYIQEDLEKLGITPDYSGYKQCLRSVELAVEDEDRLLNVSKRLYPEVAESLDCKTARIERNIRTIIFHAWKIAPRYLNEIARFPLDVPPSVTEFLSILTTHTLQKKKKKQS